MYHNLYLNGWSNSKRVQVIFSIFKILVVVNLYNPRTWEEDIKTKTSKSISMNSELERDQD